MSRSKLIVAYIAMALVMASMAFGQRKLSNPPTITAISPTSATAGGATFTLTVTGTNFASGAVIQWQGASSGSISTTFISDTQLTASIPATLIATAGTAQVAVYVAGRFGGTSNAVTFTINAAPTTTTTTTTSPLTITTTSVPIGMTATAYSATLTASGGTSPYTWSVGGGALPPGLTLSAAGAISGTPTTSGSYSFTGQVRDTASGVATYTYAMTIGIGTTPLSITTPSLPGGTAGTAYTSTTLAASGGTSPYTWSVASGSTLPAGLSLSTAGALSGTPTTAGSFSFSVQAKDSANNTATQTYSLSVAAAAVTAPSGTLSSYCVNGTYGPCGDPYEGLAAPANQQPISACNTNITAGGNYKLTQDIGTDATQMCIKFYYPSGSINFDMGGHTITGCVSLRTNQGNNVIFNGSIVCNGGDVSSALYFGTATGRVHHIFVQNSLSTGGFNILDQSTGVAGTAIQLKFDHIASTVPPTPNANRTRNIAVDGSTTATAPPVEAAYNYITCQDNASACQGVELYNAPYSSIHDNYFNLPTSCTSCTDTPRGIIFDHTSDNSQAYNNYFLVLANRGIRVRNSHHINIYNNNFDQVMAPGRFAAVHIGENDSSLDDDFVYVYGNSFTLGPGGNGVVSAAATDVYVYNNSVSCANGDCSGVGYFALGQVPAATYAQTGTTITVYNNNVSALDAAGKAAVMACGPPGDAAYRCAGSLTATSSAIVYSGQGTAVGNGAVNKMTTVSP